MIFQAHQPKALTPERPINRGVALLPDHAYSARFIELQSRATSVLEIGPPLSLSGNLPHITLVQGAFASSTDFTCFLDTARASVSKTGLGAVHPTRLVYKPRGWIFLEVNKDSPLDSAHRSVADITASHLIPPTDFSKVADYSDTEKASFLKFGYRYMYDSFYPHLTLGRVQSEPNPHQMERLNQIARELNLFSTCHIAKATIYEMGESGTHAKTVLSQDL